MRIDIHSDQSKKIINLYEKGNTMQQVADSVNISRARCRNVLVKSGTKIRIKRKSHFPQMKKEKQEAIIKMYLDGIRKSEIYRKLNTSWQGVNTVLIRHGIPTRKDIGMPKKYELNETYFEKIDTEEKAYWLGFISADGSLSDKSLRFGQQIQDLNHLNKFATSLKSTHPVRIVNKTDGKGGKIDIAWFQVNSVKLITDLKNLGVYPKKGSTIKPCTKISKRLLRHYWRGMIDGDGSIYKRKNQKTSKWCIYLCGNEFMTNGFKDFITNSGIKSEAQIYVRKKNILHKINYSGKHIVKQVVKLLYDHSKIFLDRKKKLYEQILIDSKNGDD